LRANPSVASSSDVTSTVHNRIRLHQDANGGGWADCLGVGRPNEWELTGRNQNPGNIQVSSNKAAC
jgi:hypothetical protein